MKNPPLWLRLEWAAKDIAKMVGDCPSKWVLYADMIKTSFRRHGIEAELERKKEPQEELFIIGIDKGGPDQTAVALRVDNKVHVIPDPFARHLAAHLQSLKSERIKA